MWRHRLVVLACVLIALASALLLASLSEPQHTAEASIVIGLGGPARASQTTSAPDAARYVADQVEILRSRLFAKKVAAAANANAPGRRFTKELVVRSLRIASSPNTDVVSVQFDSRNPGIAIAGANAVGKAYQDLLDAQATKISTAALDRLDAAIMTINNDLADIASRRAALLATSPTPPDLSFKLAALATAEKTALGERQPLISQREQLKVRAPLAGQLVTFLPAQLSPSSSGTSLPRQLAVALVLGILAGAALSYFLESRRRVIVRSDDLEPILGAPLLADIPDFSDAAGGSTLPAMGVLWADTARRSVANKGGKPRPISVRGSARTAFSAGASVLTSRAAAADVQSLVVVSASLGDGKTTAVANLGVSAVDEGSRVLLIDADLRTQSLTRLLAPYPSHPRSGSFNGAMDSYNRAGPAANDVGGYFRRSIVRVGVGPEMSVDLLAMAQVPDALGAFRSEAARQFFHHAREAYDLVIIDTPPLLEGPHAAAAAVHGQAAVVVVPDRVDRSLLGEVMSRLDLLGLVPIGFVHNGVRARDGRAGVPAERQGSPRDDLATVSPASIVPPRRPPLNIGS